VKSEADREGFFKQIRDGIVSLARERENFTTGNNSSDSVASDTATSSLQPTSNEPSSKKQKIGVSAPFAWFRQNTTVSTR
jgi:hypothetical protein